MPPTTAGRAATENASREIPLRHFCEGNPSVTCGDTSLFRGDLGRGAGATPPSPAVTPPFSGETWGGGDDGGNPSVTCGDTSPFRGGLGDGVSSSLTSPERGGGPLLKAMVEGFREAKEGDHDEVMVEGSHASYCSFSTVQPLRWRQRSAAARLASGRSCSR